jgi:hypothetical protein
MATSVLEQIAELIVERLRGIKLEDGYSFDVGDVTRPTRTNKDDTPRDKNIEVTSSTRSRVEELDFPGNPPGLAYEVTFSIKVFCRDSDRSDTAKSTSENEVEDAIRTSITSTGSDWHKFDNLAITADFADVEPFETSTGDHAGINVPLVVTYRTLENDSTTVR